MATKKRRGSGEGAIFYSETKKLWVARIELPMNTAGDRRRKEVTATTKAGLEAKLKDQRRDFYIHGDLPTGTLTVRDWLTYWLNTIAAKRDRPKTLAGYRSVVNQQIIPAIGNIKLDKMNGTHVRRVHDHITRAGLSSTYALNAHRVLSKALKDAVRDRKMLTNPAELVDAPRKTRAQLHALSVDEAVAVVKMCAVAFNSEPYDPEPALWATYLLTGSRRGEVIGLESRPSPPCWPG